MTREPFIAHSELTNEIYIVQGQNKYRVTEQVIHAVKAIKALEQEPTTKNDLGVDLIPRADVLKLMQDNWHTHNGDWAMQESMDDIRALPSVTPQEPILDQITEIIEPLRHLPIGEMSDIEWDILRVIDKYKAEVRDNNG